MSFLEPLFLLGAIAIGAPIFFHLIRRSPRGRVRFSSLMFLRQSPPRITRRSRLDNILLLLLRVAALILLALAFARPFLRRASDASTADAGRRVALMVDTSASMRREGLWAQAIAKVEEVLDGVTSADRVGLFTFDRSVRELVALEEENAPPVDERRAQVRRALAEQRPTWASTRVGEALVSVADLLDASRHGSADESAASDALLEIVLVSDLQEGSHLEALAAYDWPDRIRLRVERVTSPESSNAGVVVLPRSETESEEGDEERIRVRVSNEAGSQREHFSLRWAYPEQRESVPPQEAITVDVPPGESRVVGLPLPPEGKTSTRVLLEGDADEFDNTYHVIPFRREEITVVYLGDDRSDDANGPRYYLDRALESGRATARVIEQSAEHPLTPKDFFSARLVVVTRGIEPSLSEHLREYARSGGTVLWVLKDVASAPALAEFIGSEDLHAEEAEVKDYAMLGEIEFAHPIFAPFADVRFSDFTKIRFWHHRRIQIEASLEPRVLASFDDGDPAFIELRLDRGRVLILTSAWHPADSQLALSTKFVPLIARIVERDPWGFETKASYEVGEDVPMPPARAAPAPRTVHGPEGEEFTVESGEDRFEGADRPGIYEVALEGEIRRFAVNVDPNESRTAPLAVEELEGRGVRLGGGSEEAERRRQMLDKELEKKQKLWKWALVAALFILIIETWLAGHLDQGRRSTGREEATE